MAKRIYLSPGHSGVDSGAVGQNGTKESWAAKKVSYFVKKRLVKLGYKVKRFNNLKCKLLKSLELNAKSESSNKFKADFHIPIHFNAGDKSVTGAEILCAAGNVKICTQIINAYCQTTGIKNRGVKTRPDLSEINNVKGKSIYFECDFISNPTVEKKIQKKKYRKKMGYAIANAIHHAVG